MSIIFPAEWHAQDFVQLTWVHPETDFESNYKQAVACFVKIADAISARQKLLIVCECKIRVMQELGDIAKRQSIYFFECESNDVWARDHAAITVFDEENTLLYDFRFNGWGNKFPAEKDTAITKQVFDSGFFNHARYVDLNDFVFEGGSIESNGAGVLLTTEGCLLTPTRNPQFSKADIETYLKEQFGAHTVLWLAHGYIAGDDTDSHIDTLARFVNEDTITYVQCTDVNDEHYAELQAMEKELQGFCTPQGKPYNLVPLPMTTPQFGEDGERLPATYANFLILNEAVLLPIYNCATDSEAVNIMQTAFPDREIVPIDCSVLITQHGSLHCVTMQFPHNFVHNCLT
ncbi:MAG: agmatine deiminase family protein [Bacteroidales bacterium]|jgi:agmatine/peptidylarginine deiminase|nr:agmatine deiminase family protein [Bacteroidales bacterium]